ncbi:MAG: MFS transporter, partial [Ignavibacteriales bacterium CG_4_9_14_3_um_filter_34_10]
TVIKSKEYPPEELKNFSENHNVQSNDLTTSAKSIPFAKFQYAGLVWLLTGILGGLILFFILQQEDFGLYVLFFGSAIFGLLQIYAAYLTKQNKTGSGFISVLNDLYKMPKTMKQLAVVQFFSWFALFAMWIYTTPAVTHHIYGATDSSSEIYNDGADWVGVLMSVYNGFAAIMAFFIIWLANKTSRKQVHAISLSIGAVSLISFYFIKNPQLLLISEFGIGLAWASILAMPYAILAGSIPGNKMGVYMGIFNFFIVIPQITAAAILGFFVRSLFNGEAIYALLLGGFSLFIAAILVKFVDDKDA